MKIFFDLFCFAIQNYFTAVFTFMKNIKKKGKNDGIKSEIQRKRMIMIDI